MDFRSLKIELKFFPQTPVRKYYYSLRNDTEERSSDVMKLLQAHRVQDHSPGVPVHYVTLYRYFESPALLCAILTQNIVRLKPALPADVPANALSSS